MENGMRKEPDNDQPDEPSGAPRKLSIKQNMLWNAIGATLYQGCQWLITIVVVVLSSNYENSGILAFAMASGNIFGALSVFNAHTYQLSDTENKFLSADYISFRTITVCSAYIICIVYSVVVSPSAQTTAAIAIYLLFKSDESFVNVLYGIDQKGFRMDYMGVSQGVRGILTLALFSVTLAVSDNLPLAILAMTIPCVAITILYDVPHAKRLDIVKLGFVRDKLVRLFKTCLPLAMALLLYSAVAAFARQSFGVNYGEEALGIYAAIATPCVIVQVFVHYLYAPYLVPLAELFSSGNKRGTLKLLAQSVLVLMAAIAVFLLTVLIIGEPLVQMIYGASIAPHTWMVLPAAFAASVMALEFALMDILIVAQDRINPLIMNAIALLTCIAITAPCTEAWYMNGINIALIVSLGIGFCYGAGSLTWRVHKMQSS